MNDGTMMLGDVDVRRELEIATALIADQQQEIATLKLKVEQLGLRLAKVERNTGFLGVVAPTVMKEPG